jgi:GTP-binding protein HflX
VTLLIPYEHGEIVGLAHEQAQVIAEEHTNEGTRITARVPSELAARFAPYVEERAPLRDK